MGESKFYNSKIQELVKRYGKEFKHELEHHFQVAADNPDVPDDMPVLELFGYILEDIINVAEQHIEDADEIRRFKSYVADPREINKRVWEELIEADMVSRSETRSANRLLDRIREES